MSFTKVLNNLMKDSGISAKKLGESIGVSDVIVGKWMKGESVPNLNNAIGVAKYFGVSLDTLADSKDLLDSKQYFKIPILGEIWTGLIHIYGLPKGEYIYTNSKELDNYNPSECYCLKYIDGSSNPINPKIQYLFVHQQNQCMDGDYIIYQQMDSVTDSGLPLHIYSLRIFVREDDNIVLIPITENEQKYTFRKQDINMINVQGVVINKVVLV